jgi:hypothetical protein
MRYTGHVARIVMSINADTVLVGKSEGKRSRETRPRWEDNTKMYFKEIECEYENWIQLDHVQRWDL